MTRLGKADMATAVFGSWDGCISVLGFLLADRHAVGAARTYTLLAGTIAVTAAVGLLAP
jgi:hypothetical protein